MNETDVLIDISQKLNSINIPYMLTGSLAMNYYAEPRMTRDIDLVIMIKKGMEKKLINKFKEDYYISKNAIEQAIRNNSMFNIIHNETVVKADFIIRKETRYRKEEFKRRKNIEIDGEEISIVSREDLIISKLEWAKGSNSEMQKKDILNLLNGEYNKNYLKRWLQSLELYEYFKEFIGEGYL